jgi:hypothetical protein
MVKIGREVCFLMAIFGACKTSKKRVKTTLAAKLRKMPQNPAKLRKTILGIKKRRHSHAGEQKKYQ